MLTIEINAITPTTAITVIHVFDKPGKIKKDLSKRKS